jgi:hypothetical protein
MIGDVRQPSCALQAGVADDPLGEDHDAAVPGLVHCYPNQVLFLATRFWSSYCRYCTRSRMVEGGGEYTFSASSLSDLGLRCTHDADNTVWCSTKFHDAAATNTISPIVT